MFSKLRNNVSQLPQTQPESNVCESCTTPFLLFFCPLCFFTGQYSTSYLHIMKAKLLTTNNHNYVELCKLKILNQVCNKNAFTEQVFISVFSSSYAEAQDENKMKQIMTSTYILSQYAYIDLRQAAYHLVLHIPASFPFWNANPGYIFGATQKRAIATASR